MLYLPIVYANPQEALAAEGHIDTRNAALMAAIPYPEWLYNGASIDNHFHCHFFTPGNNEHFHLSPKTSQFAKK